MQVFKICIDYFAHLIKTARLEVGHKKLTLLTAYRYPIRLPNYALSFICVMYPDGSYQSLHVFQHPPSANCRKSSTRLHGTI